MTKSKNILIGIRVSPEWYAKFKKYGESKALKLSTAIRMLAIDQLNYLETGDQRRIFED